jgi:phage gp29-like protein
MNVEFLKTLSEKIEGSETHLIQNLTRVRREMITVAWSCEKNQQNKDPEKGVRLRFERKKPYEMTRNKTI